MKTHPQIQARFLTEVQTDVLIEVAHSGAFRRPSELLFRAIILIELAYRLRIRAPWVPEAVWDFVFKGRVPSPPGLCAPSEAWPLERAWAHH